MNHYLLVVDMQLLALTALINRKWRFLNDAYLAIQNEPMDFSICTLAENLQKAMCVYQQCNSKKAALVFFICGVSQGASAVLAKRITIDASILAMPLLIFQHYTLNYLLGL